MENNDILRRVRYVFNLSDSKMMEIYSSTGYRVTRAQLSDWLKKDDDPAFKECSDQQLAYLLNGFINAKRGKREGEQPPAEKRLTNNIVFRKLKIALNLKDEDILHLLELAGFRMGKTELSAFFRKTSHKNYMPCKDQVLRNFLQGLQAKYHKKKPGAKPDVKPDVTSDAKPGVKPAFKWK